MTRDGLSLDLGCGQDKVPGAIGMDRARLPSVDVIYDVERIPYPFRADSFAECYLHHLLEHVSEPLEVLEEVWRVGRPGAIVSIRVPHFSSLYAWSDPTHRRPYTYHSFDYLTEEGPYPYYAHARFEIVERRLIYLMALHRDLPVSWWMRPLLAGAWVLEAIANLMPHLCERLWGYWVGGFEELHVTLRVVK